MKARRLFIGALWLNLVAVTATAKTMVVRPDPCPAPADAPRVLDIGAADALDLNPDRFRSRSVLVLYPAPEEGWASARILARFDFEAERSPIRPDCRRASRAN